MRNCVLEMTRPARQLYSIVILIGLNPVLAQAESLEYCTEISSIIIDTQDIFPEEEEGEWFKYSANLLHFQTRDHAIRQELLFNEGDCLDIELVEETARNLRSLGIFADAQILIEPGAENGTSSIRVQTKDRFTLRAEISASQNAGTTKNRISFGDKNLLGLNKSLHFSQSSSDDEEKTRYIYKDSRFFGDWAFYGKHEEAYGGTTQSFSLSQPFRSLDDHLSWGGGYDRNTQNFVYSLDDGEQIEIEQFKEGENLFFTRELGNRDDSNRFGMSLHSSQHSFLEETSPFPIDLPSRLEKVDLEFSSTLTRRSGFRVVRGLDSLIYREDISLLEAWIIGAGIQWRNENEVTRYHQTFRLGYQHTRFLADQWFSSTNIDMNWRIHAGLLKEHNSTAYYHLYYLPSENQAWVSGVTWQYAWLRDGLSEPLTMGGNVGLRGYPEDAFSGNKSLLFNLEHRLRFPSPWESVGLGQAIFADAGYAWDRNMTPRAADLRVDVGWGLRVDIPSLFGKDILRFDVAMDTHSGELLTTITLGQVFRYDALADNTTKDF